MNNSIITSFKTLKREFFYFPLGVVGGFELSRLLHLRENIKVMWKDILGFEGFYQASTDGDIRSIFRYKKILKPKIHKGYKSYVLHKNKKKHYLQGNRLVASAFLGLDLNNKNLCACHKNDIREDNRAVNLFIGTHSDNTQDMLDKGRGVDNKGSNNGMSKYTEEQIKHVISLLKDYGNTHIEKMTGVNNRVISDVRHGKRWKYLSM